MSFEIRFTDALILMPKFSSTLKALIGNKEKLSEMARTSMNEHCSVVILNKLPRKLGDPCIFLIPCKFPGMDECLALADLGMDECLALADLGASINLMPLSVWEGLSLPKHTPTCMTLELVDRSTGRALIDVHKGELTLRIGNKAITYNLDQTVRNSANYNQMTANKIDVICEIYSQEVLGFFDVTASGNPTPYDDPIVSTTSPTLTPFGDSDFLLFEEADAFLGLEDDPNSPKFNLFYYDSEGDILLLEAILNSEPLPPLPNHKQYMPSYKKELKVCEAKTVKSFVDEPLEVELKDLPPHLEYTFLEGNNKLPVIIAKELGDEEISALIKVLKSHKRAIAWKLSDTQGGFAVVENEENKLIATRLVTGWQPTLWSLTSNQTPSPLNSQEVLDFSNVTASGNPTPQNDPIVSATSPTLTPFGDSDFLLLEEADAFLGLEDDPDSSTINPFYYDPEGDILLLEAILNSEPSPPLPNQEQNLPSFKEELKAYEAQTVKSSVDEPPKVELKDLPYHLEYAFLEGNNKLPVIIAKELRSEEKVALIKVLKSHKRAIAWKLSDIQGINPE
nr:reverse transcriptase domain-containing protein [Tanacetum cinerariifolium]